MACRVRINVACRVGHSKVGLPLGGRPFLWIIVGQNKKTYLCEDKKHCYGNKN